MSLRATVLELPARFGQVDAALAEVEAELQRAPPGDLVLLPEASLTGYLPDPSALAEPLDGPTARRCAKLARRFDTVLVAPLIERQGAQVFNALRAFGPKGVLFHYRKRHPWHVETWATPGTDPYPLVELAGCTLSAAICFDVHFLTEAQAALGSADVLLFSSAWVDEPNEDARATLLPAVARRLDCAVVNANWGPGTPAVRGQGGSMVLARDGSLAARCRGPARRLDVTLVGG